MRRRTGYTAVSFQDRAGAGNPGARAETPPRIVRGPALTQAGALIKPFCDRVSVEA